MNKKFDIKSRLVVYSLIFFIIYMLSFVFLTISAINDSYVEKSPNGVDYMMLYTAGKTVLEGEPSEIFDVQSQHDRILSMLHFTMPDDVRWYYPPTVLLAIVSMFAVLPYYASLSLWLIITLAMAVGSAYIWLPSNRKKLAFLVLGFPGVMYTFRWGQNSFLSTTLLFLGIACMEKKPIIAGLMFGLMTFKPQLAFFPLLILLITKEWKVLKWSIIFSFMTVALSIVVFGTEVWVEFFKTFFGDTPDLFSSVWEKTSAIQPTLYSTLRLLGFQQVTANIGMLVAGVAVTIITASIWKKTKRYSLRGSAMILGIFVFMPYFIQYDLMVLCIPFVLLLNDVMDYGYHKYEVAILASLWIMPLINMILVHITKVQISPLVVMLVLVYVWHRANANLNNVIDQEILSNTEPCKRQGTVAE